MPLLSNLSVASLVVIIAYQYYDARSSPVLTRTAAAEASWERYLGRREVILHTLNVTQNPDAPLYVSSSSRPVFPSNRTRFPIRESWDEETPMYTAWDLFPAAYDCPYELERVGHLGDGGKWVCGMSQYEAAKQPQVMYSFGVGGEVSFEVEWIRRTNVYVHAFDYSVTTTGIPALDKMTDRFKLHQLGVSGEDYTEDGDRFATLKTIMADLGHDYVDVIKMDVEGSEFPTLDTFLEDYEGKALPFGQLLIEIHLWEGSPENIPDLVAWWEKLESFGLRPVSDEANLLAVTFGPVIPCCSEVRKEAPGLEKLCRLTLPSTRSSTPTTPGESSGGRWQGVTCRSEGMGVIELVTRKDQTKHSVVENGICTRLTQPTTMYSMKRSKIFPTRITPPLSPVTA